MSNDTDHAGQVRVPDREPNRPSETVETEDGQMFTMKPEYEVPVVIDLDPAIANQLVEHLAASGRDVSNRLIEDLAIELIQLRREYTVDGEPLAEYVRRELEEGSDE